jgi:hypothetical protein
LGKSGKQGSSVVGRRRKVRTRQERGHQGRSSRLSEEGKSEEAARLNLGKEWDGKRGWKEEVKGGGVDKEEDKGFV